MKNTLMTLTAGLMIAGAAQAATIGGSTTDAHILSGGAGAQGATPNFFAQPGLTTMSVGRTDAGTGRNAAAVFAFQLVDLGAGNEFGTGTLNFSVLTDHTLMSADLYGIDARGTGAVTTADFYFGSATDGSADVTKLQDSILAADSGIGARTSADITSWLNEQYDGGNGIGSFVFLRLSATNGNSNIFDVNRGFSIASADAASGTPFLDYTVVPEPGSYALLAGLLGLSYVMVRRRQA
ncbi:PEP-CTERM sorting domain-containing protein [Puniceicoccaceae bacterium]|nr:PEP-CTERM sorting domain-containing protein [Puniceicoccaceae bacterium]